MRYAKTTIHVLNELVKIHYDRIEGYNLSLKVLKHHDERLEYIFRNCRAESKECIQQLAEQICRIGGYTCNETTLAGMIFRGWMRFKIFINAGIDTPAVLLNCCRFGEYALLEAYDTALYKKHEISDDSVKLIDTHREMLLRSCRVIKEYKRQLETGNVDPMAEMK